MLVMARCEGVAPLQQLAMGRVASSLGGGPPALAASSCRGGGSGAVSRVKLRDLEIPIHLKEELEAFL
jgi:hypothetical protein